MLGEPVYSMALGGYGPLEYLHLAMHVAPRLHPRVLLVAFYFGNDLIEACRAARQRPYWQAWRDAQAGYNCDPPGERAGKRIPAKRFAAAREWLSRHSVMYSLVRNMFAAHIASRDSESGQHAQPGQRMAWADPAASSVRLIFTPQLRLSVLDPREPRVQDGLRITKRAFGEIKESTDAAGTRLLVVLIPTKERAYCPYLQEAGELPDAFVALCATEDAVKAELKQFLGAAKIAYVDVAPAMEAEVRKHVQIYPPGTDGHPQAAGYRAIAGAVHAALRRQSLP
jgi:hypothetical protein